MREAKKFTILTCITLAIFLPSCQVARYFVYNFADIRDHKKFPAREVHKGPETFRFFNALQPTEPPASGDADSFEEFMEDNKTVAILVIRNDSILYEKYFKGYDEESIVPTFSMAKSVTSILIGAAINDGLIKSVNEPIIKYIPELEGRDMGGVTIEHLLQMTSGIKFNESYVNPFGDAASFYYGRNLRKLIRKMKAENKPGTKFKYSSGDTQLLGLVLERTLKDRTVSAYLEEKLWGPMGMEYDASWSIDRKKEGLEKTFCCINGRARDYAKIGRLYLNKGNWNGKQLIPKEWVERSTRVDIDNGSAAYYQYQWWLPSRKGDFMAAGILGQYIYVNPAKNLVIVRLGKKTGKTDWWKILRGWADYY